ncbi:hypothetical protein E4U30_006331 [Claviceps sp. LM220 group G6]|nr:hypothetical protein E4U30_006331 [Claviceps sp. LM220 group G6]KAG6120793.1 hypothetical protein E4U14_003076 [Claviceps sp. LM454 group G7]
MAGKRKRGGKDGAGCGATGSKKHKKEMMPIDLSSNSTPTLEVKPFVENPTGDNRKREAELYEKLGSVVEDVRNDAAECIVASLFQGDGAAEIILERHLSRRLFRGLASGREGSRLGFSLVITEILLQLYGDGDLAQTKYTGLTFEKVLGILADKTKSVGNVSGQEERDHHLGQVFGLECFVKSKILSRDVSRWNAVLDMLLKLSHKKIWLRPQCGWILVQAMEQMTEDVTKATLTKIAGAGMAQTPEGVAAWIVSLNRYPKLQVAPWKNPLSNKSLKELAAVLKESFKDAAKDPKEKQNGAKQASWSAQLHFVWDLILARFLSDNSNPKDEDFDQFWCRVVDDGLFSKQATDGQKFKGFMVFEKMLKGFSQRPSNLESLFSRNFMSCLLNQAAKEDRYLNRAATKALKAIEEVVSSHPDALAPILANLLGKHGSYGFDQRSSSKTVDKILQNVNEHNVASVLAVVKRPIKLMKSQSIIEAQVTVRNYSDYLAKILSAFASTASSGKDEKAGKPAGEDGTKRKSADKKAATSGSFDKTLQELTHVAYGHPAEIPKEALTDQIREMCRSRLETSLAKLARASTDFAVFCKAVASIDSSAMTMTAEIKKAKDEALSRMEKLLKRKLDAAQGLAMLHAISIFQLYNEDPDAMDVLDDLSQCYDKLGSGDATGKSSADGGSELLVEILLSMVARPSSLMREVSQQVFGVFTSQMSDESMQLLTGPLASDESTKGQRELFNTEDDAMDVDSDASEGEDEDDKSVIDVEDVSDFEIDSNLEFVDVKGDGDGDDEQEEDDEEEEEEEEEDDDDDDASDDDEADEDSDNNSTSNPSPSKALNQDGHWDNPEELDNILGKILNSHRLDQDAEAESSSSEGDMSDSQMFALEAQLSAAIAPRIKANKPDARKQKKDAKQSVVNFKHRILDLLDIYVKNEPLSRLTFAVLLPLLMLMRTTSTKALANRAYDVILNLRKAIKKARAPGGARAGPSAATPSASSSKLSSSTGSSEAAAAPQEELLSLLRDCHDEAGRDDSQAHAKAASTASLIVAAALFRQDREVIGEIAGVYAQTEAAWVLKRAGMHSCFFREWHDWAQSMRGTGLGSN